MESIDWTSILPAIAGIVGAVLVIAGIVVKLTPSQKDDEVFDKIKSIVEPVIDSVDGENDEPNS